MQDAFIIYELYIYLLINLLQIDYFYPCKIEHIKGRQLDKRIEKNYYLIMPEAYGDLNDFFLVLFLKFERGLITNKELENIIIDILLNISKMLIVITSYNIYFLDFKLENILYIITNDKKLKLFAADLGSFATEKDEDRTGSGITPNYSNFKEVVNLRKKGLYAAALIRSDLIQYIIGAFIANINRIKKIFEREFDILPKLKKINTFLTKYDSYWQEYFTIIQNHNNLRDTNKSYLQKNL